MVTPTHHPDRRGRWRRAARRRACEPLLLCGCTAEVLCDECALPTSGVLAASVER